MTLWVVLPSSVDDPATPSGGNRYDRAVCDRLARSRDVHEIALTGSWPRPTSAARRVIARALSDIPDKSTVLVDGLVACGLPEVLEPEAQRLRLVVLVHLPLGDESPAAADLVPLERRALHAAARVVATSAGAARRLIELHDLAPDRVFVAPPGVDLAPVAAPQPDGGRLLCVAAVTHRKGQDILVAALSGLGDLSWTCTFVGANSSGVPLERSSGTPLLDQGAGRGHAAVSGTPGTQSGAHNRTGVPLERSTGTPGTESETHNSAGVPLERSSGTGERLRFVGARAGDELDASYAQADLLVLPSRAETYGMVVTEALARGIPVLGTQVNGVPEALGAAPDGTIPGRLVPPGDPDALAEALREWLTDADLRQRWRAAALGRRETLRDWDETTRLLNEVLDT